MTIVQNRVWRNDVVLYETTIGRGGDSVPMRSNLALAYLVNQDFNKAQTEFEEALRRDPRSPTALHGMGRLLATEHQYVPAAHWLEQALAVEPGDVQASIWLAYVQEQLGNLRDAEQTLRAAMAQTSTPVASLKLADFLQRHGRFEEAERILRDVLRTDPLNAAAHNSLGTVLFKKGDVAGAEEQFRVALRYDRWMVDAHANLAAVAGARSDWVSALRHYQDALALSPSNADLYYAMGVMLTRSGDASTGSRALERAVALDPELEQAVRQFQNKPK
jgi:Tfp pilus assembly protein PilF